MVVFDGLIMKGKKIIIPMSMRSSLLELVHAGHKGVEKNPEKAHDLMFWTRISNDITQLVLNCSTCLEHRTSNSKEPLMPKQFLNTFGRLSVLICSHGTRKISL